jgi:hypothetical protein
MRFMKTGFCVGWAILCNYLSRGPGARGLRVSASSFSFLDPSRTGVSVHGM